ncbi:TRAP transporter small permease subunit [Escherichia coli]|nr:TRAP transporter small permease subunit [Escherichia coli]MCE3962356.1 TRAP transporter small permease subunit [Escherichia coli]MCE3977508.1 TRAP transporter small permease subunit [Escherichia coli]MCE3987446.1 TRAP transporter small permease subunit [Escherichia coli]MCE3992617.1 TRAP transporter small permease subunit [Escherichia coli]MCE4007448.1 TRAP transporter small permease subunit [Escherichia coli]
MRLLGKMIEVAAVLTLFILVIMTIAAVIMRYCFHMPLQWTEEVSGLLMIWVVMFGAVVAERDNTHLSIPFLADALTSRGHVFSLSDVYYFAGGHGLVSMEISCRDSL